MIILDLISGPIIKSYLYMAAIRRDKETLARNHYYLDEGHDDLFTPLQHAIIDSDYGTMHFLKEQGADFNTVNMHHMSPLHIAALFSPPWFIQYLIHEGVEVEWIDLEHRTALHYAIAFRRVANAIRLTELGPAVVNNWDFYHTTPLIEACKRNLTEVVRVLLAHGARDLDEPEALEDEYTCLHHAVRHGNAEIVDLLLQAEPDVEVRNRKNYTALHTALSFGWVYITDILMSAGADPRIEDENGETGLFYGCRNDDHGLVKGSLERGVDPWKRNREGLVAMDVMCNTGEKRYLGLLIHAMMQRFG